MIDAPAQQERAFAVPPDEPPDAGESEPAPLEREIAFLPGPFLNPRARRQPGHDPCRVFTKPWPLVNAGDTTAWLSQDHATALLPGGSVTSPGAGGFATQIGQNHHPSGCLGREVAVRLPATERLALPGAMPRPPMRGRFVPLLGSDALLEARIARTPELDPAAECPVAQSRDRIR